MKPAVAQNLQRLLRPKSIAIFGGAWGEEVARQLKKIGYSGQVYPVHPKKAEVAGFRTFKTVAELPEAPDASFVGVNRDTTIDVMRELSARGAGGAVCFAAGFKEAGDEGLALHHRLLEAAGDMAFFGPNCYGTLNYLDGATLWPDQHGGTRVERGVAMISQSGNIGVNISMQMRGLPLAYVFTLGNQARIGFSGLIEALLEDTRVTAIGIVMEAIDDVEGFQRAAIAAHRKKIPIVAMKLGASERGAAATLSHTASLAGADASVDAFFARLGVARVRTLPSLIESLKLVHQLGPLTGRSIASMSCSGGEAALMADLLEGRDLAAKPFTPEQKSRVEATLSDLVTVANPLDYHTFIWGNEQRLTATFEAVMRAEFDLTCLVLDFPRADRCSDATWQPTIRAFAEAARRTGSRATLVASLGELMPEQVVAQAAELGIGALAGLTEGLDAAEAAARIGESWRAGAPKPAGIAGPMPEKIETFNEWEGKRALAEFGLPVPKGRLVCSVAEAEAAFSGLTAPVVVKACSRTLLHKTEAGGVRLKLTTKADVAEATAAMLKLADQVIIEEMVTDAVTEIIVGVSRDPQFGPVLVVGAGGILVELIADSQTLLLPTTAAEVESAIRGLKVAKLLDGFRGRPKGDFSGLVDVVMAVARYAEANADRLAELDINPLLVRPEGKGAVAVDALVRLGT